MLYQYHRLYSQSDICNTLLVVTNVKVGMELQYSLTYKFCLGN